ASVRTTDRPVMARLYRFLQEIGALDEAFPIGTSPEHRALSEDWQSLTEPYDARAVRSILPPLFQSYLRAGAKVCAEPAIDTFLGSVDFLTVLKIEAMTTRFERKYR